MASRRRWSSTHPNRGKAASKATQVLVVILLLLVSAALIAIVTIGGWDELQGAKALQIAYIVLYVADGVPRRALEPRRAAGRGGARDRHAHLRR